MATSDSEYTLVTQDSAGAVDKVYIGMTNIFAEMLARHLYPEVVMEQGGKITVKRATPVFLPDSH